MEKKKIRDLAKGEYIREAKKYSTYKWEDTNHETLRKGGQGSLHRFYLLTLTTMAQQKKVQIAHLVLSPQSPSQKYSCCT